MTIACPQILNSIGLGFGMIGVVVIFVYGPPQPDLDEGVKRVIEAGTVLADGRTAAEHDADVIRRRVRHSIMSKVGLGLIFVGFAFQLWAVWM